MKPLRVSDTFVRDGKRWIVVSVGQKFSELHPDTEQDDLRRGFAECWRVLGPGGTLVFKWADKLERVEPHFPAVPIVGTRRPRVGQTRWFIFYKAAGT